MNPLRIERLLEAFHTRATIAHTFGMTLSFTDKGSAVIDLPYNPGLDHARNAIHGGVYMTLIDSAAWFTAAAAHPEDIWVATSELTVHFLRPASQTNLQAVGRLIKTGKRQDIVEAHVYDGAGDLVGHGIGTFTVLPDLPLKKEG